MTQPFRIFSKSIPPPPAWTASYPKVPSDATFRSTWKEVGHRTVPHAVDCLSASLRGLYKHTIQWPDDQSALASVSPADYLITLLQPIPSIFNQLHLPGFLEEPMQCVRVDLGQTAYGVTFASVDFDRHQVVPPMVMSINTDLFTSIGELSSAVDDAISKALQRQPSTPSLIVTNLKEIAVFTTGRMGGYERVKATDISLALQTLTASYLKRTLSDPEWIGEPLMPGFDVGDDDPSVLPFGPPQDPNEPLLPDDQVFATHHRHSDFDLATLVRDRRPALQFFRWHDHARNTVTKAVALPDDYLTGLTHQIQSFSGWEGLTPLFPYDPTDLPKETIDHISLIKRKSPLEDGGVGTALHKSKSFKLQVRSVLSEGSSRSMCSLYLCQVTSIDDEEILSPPIVLKIFDDRFQPLQFPPEEDQASDEDVHRWFDPFVYAEFLAWNEAAAYHKLEPVQGTVFPWFYGVHTFILPNGMALPGILMEHIQGHEAEASYTRTLGDKRQIDIIKSVRHAVRILDVSNIHQADWHLGQLLLYNNPASNIDHVVLIDFAVTIQAWLPDHRFIVNNHSQALRSLLDVSPDAPFEWTLVLDHYGEPDDWDVNVMIVPVRPRAKESKVVSAGPLFPFLDYKFSRN